MLARRGKVARSAVTDTGRRRPNLALLAVMGDQGLTQDELAARVNRAIEDLFGEPGNATDTQVRRWTSGTVTWPHARYLLALEHSLGRRALDLGFIPRSPGSLDALSKARSLLRPHPQPLERERVRRREFLGLAAGAALTSATTSSPPTGRIGMSHVSMLEATLDELHALDGERGGGDLVKIAEREYAKINVTLTSGTFGDKVGRALCSAAGEFTTSAGWFAFDSGDQESAERYYDRALRLALLAGDSILQAHVLIAMAFQASTTGRPGECVAISRAALEAPAARQHPLIAALFHAREGIGHARNAQVREAARAFASARRALDRHPDGAEVPGWLTIFGPGELLGLEAQSHLFLGSYADAESSARQTQDLISAQYARNRLLHAITQAHAQLGRHVVEEACATATGVIDAAGRLRSDRGVSNLLEFRHKVAAQPRTPASSAFLSTWEDARQATADRSLGREAG